MKEYDRENDELLYNFLNRYIFSHWKNPGSGFKPRLELFLDKTCNLDCVYCYLQKYDKWIYPKKLNNDPKNIFENAKMLIDWLVQNDYVPEHIEIFSGEPTVNPVFYEIVDYINDAFSGSKRKPSKIVVPTNFTFIISDKLTEKVEDLIRRSKIPVVLSASIDGKYCEKYRPFRATKKGLPDPRNDEYYDKVFTFAKKYGFGFHPMVYADCIYQWRKNFLWFQEMFKKFEIPYHSLYLLEVRNPEWRTDQIAEFGRFIYWLTKWSFENIANGNNKKFLEFLFKYRGFNILSSPFTNISRGLGCSIQMTLFVRLADLAIVPCHRTSYSHLIYGYFEVKDGKISGIRAHNPEMAITIYSLDARNFPYCEKCMIKEFCSHGCLGAQIEFTGDMFIPFPTLCLLQHSKIISLFKAFKDLGIYWDVASYVNREKRSWMEILYDYIDGGGKNVSAIPHTTYSIRQAPKIR